jgi:hypothetical protein
MRKKKLNRLKARKLRINIPSVLNTVLEINLDALKSYHSATRNLPIGGIVNIGMPTELSSIDQMQLKLKRLEDITNQYLMPPKSNIKDDLGKLKLDFEKNEELENRLFRLFIKTNFRPQ